MADNDREALADLIIRSLADQIGYEPAEFSDSLSEVQVTQPFDLLTVADAILGRWNLVPVDRFPSRRRFPMPAEEEPDGCR